MGLPCDQKPVHTCPGEGGPGRELPTSAGVNQGTAPLLLQGGVLSPTPANAEEDGEERSLGGRRPSLSSPCCKWEIGRAHV